MEEQKKHYEDEIDFKIKDLIWELGKRWGIILLSGLLGALVFFTYARFIAPETYVSKTSIYILNQNVDDVTLTELQTSSTLMNDCEVLVKSRAVLEAVIQQMGLDMSYDELNSRVSVEIPYASRVVEISVSSDDPYVSKDIADAVREKASENLSEVMGFETVNVVDVANLPLNRSEPNTKKLTMIGAVIGVVLACGMILVSALFNDTISTQEDVEKYLGLSTLGMIPIDDEWKMREDKRKRGKKAGKSKSS
ncbi:MAG: YveK family protein [Lachnospiraceae bacterium]